MLYVICRNFYFVQLDYYPLYLCLKNCFNVTLYVFNYKSFSIVALRRRKQKKKSQRRKYPQRCLVYLLANRPPQRMFDFEYFSFHGPGFLLCLGGFIIFNYQTSRNTRRSFVLQFVVNADRHGCIEPRSLIPQILGFALPHQTPFSFVAGSKWRAILVDPALTLALSVRLSLVRKPNASSAFVTASLLFRVSPNAMGCAAKCSLIPNHSYNA